MATYEEITNIFLTPMMRLWKSPWKDAAAQDEVVGEYLSALKDFTADELQAGWPEIRNTHKYNRWPSIAECYKACANQRADIERGRVKTLEKPECFSDSLAEAAMRTPGAKRAHELGILNDFYVEAGITGKPPGDEFFLEPRTGREAICAKIDRMKKSPLKLSLEKTLQAMIDHEKRLAHRFGLDRGKAA